MQEKMKSLTSLFGVSALLTCALLGCAPEIVFDDEHPGDGDGDSSTGGQVGEVDGDSDSDSEAVGGTAGSGIHTGGTAGGTGKAVFLDDVDSEADLEAAMDNFSEMRKRGVRIIAPPLWALVTEKNGQIVPSRYAKQARRNGFDLIAWTLERSGPLASGGGWYFQSIAELTENDGVTFELLDVLAQDVEVVGVFSDWPATVTYYANCFGL